MPSFLRVVLYRTLGFKVGKGAKLSPLSLVVAPEISIGDHTRIWPFAIVTSTSALRLGSYCQITPLAFIYGEREFVLNDKSYIGPRAVINLAERVSIGPNSGIGPNCTLYSHGVFLPYSEGFPRRFGPIEIREKVWLGVGVTVLPGVSIGPNCIVASGLVVARAIAPNSYVQGYASKLRTTSIDLIKHDKSQNAGALVEEILAGLAWHCDSFSYRRISEREYHLSLDSETARLRVLSVTDQDRSISSCASDSAIYFLFGTGTGKDLPAGTTWLNIDKLTMSRANSAIGQFLKANLEKYFGMNFSYSPRATEEHQQKRSRARSA